MRRNEAFTLPAGSGTAETLSQRRFAEMAATVAPGAPEEPSRKIMPLLRASIVVAVIFAFSPARDGAPQPGLGGEVTAAASAERPRAEEPTIESLIRDSLEPDGRAARAYEDAVAAHEAWRALPHEAQDALARLVADELGSAIYTQNR